MAATGDTKELLRGGGAKLTLRGAPEASDATERLLRDAARAGFEEIAVRTHGHALIDGHAERLRSRGVGSVLVPLFSHVAQVHDRIAGAPDALARTLVGMRAAHAAGLAVDIEVPLLSEACQSLTEVLGLAHRAVPELRAARFHLGTEALPSPIAPPSFRLGGPRLEAALRQADALGVSAELTSAERIPICAVSDEELAKTHFRLSRAPEPRERGLRACASCAASDWCPMVGRAYTSANADEALKAFEVLPEWLAATPRTTPELSAAVDVRGPLGDALSAVLRNAGFRVTRELEASSDLSLAVGDRALEQVTQAHSRGVPWILALPRGNAFGVGPLIVPGLGGCPACVQSALASLPSEPSARAEAPLVAEAIRARLSCLSTARSQADRVSLVSDRVHDQAAAVGCERCEPREPTGKLASNVALSHVAPWSRAQAPAERRLPWATVGIVGAGTAGYLTALALRKRYPELDVTVVEAPDVPVIGVGEATTPDLVEFLHETLGLDELELFRAVSPTWKLGIHFEWGKRPFSYPFHSDALLEAHAYSADHELQGLSSRLMAAGRGPVVKGALGPLALLPGLPLAYHLDNAPFVAYLARQARASGVNHRYFAVSDVRLSADRQRVEELVDSAGERLKFDFYVDCSGFRAVILGALGSEFIPYASSLFTDTALCGDRPNGGKPRPYTLAETMDAGWCWSIPMRDMDHRGYVYSSAHISREAAEAELRAKNPTLGDVRTIKFRSGRREHFSIGNVIALGNAYGFVEPLESTALHMLVYSVKQALDVLPTLDQPHTRQLLNARVGGHWDYLRAFLAGHYRFNQRRDTPFWRECREHVDLAGGEQIVELFREQAPLSCRADARILTEELTHDGWFHLFGWDNILLGQGVATQLLTPSMGRSEWARLDQNARLLTQQALDHRLALDAYEALLERRRHGNASVAKGRR